MCAQNVRQYAVGSVPSASWTPSNLSCWDLPDEWQANRRKDLYRKLIDMNVLKNGIRLRKVQVMRLFLFAHKDFVKNWYMLHSLYSHNPDGKCVRLFFTSLDHGGEVGLDTSVTDSQNVTLSFKIPQDSNGFKSAILLFLCYCLKLKLLSRTGIEPRRDRDQQMPHSSQDVFLPLSGTAHAGFILICLPSR